MATEKMKKEFLGKVVAIVDKQFDDFLGNEISPAGGIKKTVLGRRLELHMKVVDVKAGLLELDFNSRIKEKPDFNIQNGKIVLDANENQATMNFDEDAGKEEPGEDEQKSFSGKIKVPIDKNKVKK